MAEAVMYLYQGEVITTYFAHPKVCLPVKLKEGEMRLFAWGHHQKQGGRLPMGDWANLNAIKSGKWDQWFPKSVKLPILKFCEKNFEGNMHWFDVTKGHYIQGVLARDEQEQRLYIVTLIQEMPIHLIFVGHD